MATISKVQRVNGISYRAIIKRNGRVLRTKCFKTKTGARHWARRMESDAEAMEALGEQGARMTLAELGREYLERWTGRTNSRKYQIGWWIEQLGQRYISDVQPSEVRRSLEAYSRGKTRHRIGSDAAGRPLCREGDRTRSSASVNRMKAALSALFAYANKQGYTTRNPARQVAGETENNRRLRYLSEDERKELLRSCRKSRWPMLYLLVLTALMTGARKGELKSLRWEQIDFGNRLVELKRTKNDQPRVLSLPSPVVKELMKFRQPVGLVFASERRPLTAYDEKKVWSEALKSAQIEDFRFHDLRHSAASYLAMGGASLLEIADVLGHRNLQTTKRYAHLSVEHKQAITDRVLGGLQI